MNARAAEAFLQVRGLAKRHGEQVLFESLDLALDAGQTLAVIGASGSGKTTLLRILAGLTAADAGSIILDGQCQAPGATPLRGAVYLYQEPLLFPHLDVFENIAFGLRVRGIAAAELRGQVEAMLDAVGLRALARRDPATLSGGQRQRVAFGRALVVEPRLLLLDEPFSNLDPDARADMQRLCKALCAARRCTVLFVTHDLKEALIMGDRHGRLAAGRYHAYGDRAAFCADPATGVAAERAFWRDEAP
ncbi:MAG: ABC transporter ATP-binding protein [Proteobacteria bacterium]|nr:ABC transporter ATP-binding protein [Pseudomonadota bacterium]